MVPYRVKNDGFVEYKRKSQWFEDAPGTSRASSWNRGSPPRIKKEHDLALPHLADSQFSLFFECGNQFRQEMVEGYQLFWVRFEDS